MSRLHYLVRCGDCEAVLCTRLVRTERMQRIVACHRRRTGCPVAGLVVRPLAREGARA